MAADIAIYDTFSFTEKEERRSRNGSAAAVAWKYLQPVELNPLHEKITFLNQFRRIESNWDGYGAKAPNQNTIRNAITFLSDLPAAYQKMLNIEEVNITPYGTIVMEWYRDENHFVSIEIGNSKIGYLSETPDGENPYAESIEFNPNAIPQQILPLFIKIFSA